MFIWTILEYSFVFFVALFIITQMVVPALTNKPIFPLFHKSVKKKESVEEEIREERINCETEQSRINLKKLIKQKEKLIEKCKFSKEETK